MRTTCFWVALFSFIRPLSIRGDALSLKNYLNIRRNVNKFCVYQPSPIKWGVNCLRDKNLWNEHTGNLIIKAGKNGAVIFADIDPSVMVKHVSCFKFFQLQAEVVHLALPFDWELKEKQIKMRREIVTSEIEAEEKRLFAQRERLNAIRLAAWRLGPEVYDIKVKGHPTFFAKNVILERIDGWTLRDIFAWCSKEIEKLSVTADNALTLDFVRKLLDIEILYIEGIAQVWSHGYRHCDPHAENVMIRALPKKDCERMKKIQRKQEGVKFDVIDGKCAIWDKKYLVLVDSGFMEKVEDDSKHLCPRFAEMQRVTRAWNRAKNRFPREMFRMSYRNTLATEIDRILNAVPEEMPFFKEVKTYINVHKRLKDLQRAYG